jgi:hypothetical protein
MNPDFRCGCGEGFYDIFDYLTHDGDQPQWMVRLSERYSMNMFELLRQLSDLCNDQESHDVIQAAAVAFFASSIGELEDITTESIIQNEISELDEDLIRLLKEENNEQD